MASSHSILQNGFPGLRLAGVSMILAPIFLFAGGVLLSAFESGTFEERQAAIEADPMRADLGANLFYLGRLFEVLALFAFARIVATRRPFLGAAGGVLTLAGIFLAVYFTGIATMEHASALQSDREAMGELNESAGPIVAALLTAPGLTLGWPLMAFAAWRAEVLGIPRALILAVTGTLPLWVLGGFPILSPVPFVAFGIVFVPFGVDLLRAAHAHAKGATPSAGPATGARRKPTRSRES